jgi:hypothetical protein
VVYGPVRAPDLPAFLDAGLKATPEMRRVRFGLRDRLGLVPVELVMGARLALLGAAALLLLGGLGPELYSLARVRVIGVPAAALFFLAFVLSASLGPVLLPWLPGRALAVKGTVLGAVLAAAILALAHASGWPVTPLHLAAWALILPAQAGFVLLNFTGSTTYTSLSGVLKEMRLALPVQGVAAALGLALWLAGLFFPGGAA